ncbi:MAG: hypothetical protein RBS53_08140 [Bacteroidales bacterium]|nr:hypothetical protein [Bacteroidales bacterium]NLM91578.1 hypothetical protein [Bacteroidales bacterium]
MKRCNVNIARLFLLVMMVTGISFFAGGQDERPLKSHYGNMIDPHGQYRFLNVFINIIYDETPWVDPIEDPNDTWPEAYEQGINTAVPVYLGQFMDTEYYSSGGYGIMTRLYRESSFDRLVLLGDFVVVNLRQSQIAKSNDRHFGKELGVFSLQAMVRAAIELINKNGGLKTIYGYNDISEYDRFSPTSMGKPKPKEANGKIDFIQIMTRNTTYVDTSFVRDGKTVNHRLQYGQLRYGQGWGNYKPPVDLRLAGESYGYDLGTIQCVGDVNITDNPTNIIQHEFSHNLFGGNNFHASGGNHYTGGGTNTFIGAEGGYGLMGSYHSSLLSCNGYERWRMQWTSPEYNPLGHPIQAGGVPSDLSREDGPGSFVLRDFVSTGDAIRILLPYKDEGASNQYLWLENHQVGRNNKLDYHQYALDFYGAPLNPCRPEGTPGIYAYIQVGKDVLEGSSAEVFPWNETDNLRVVSAEGNWDFELMDPEFSCVAYNPSSRTELRLKPNPLAGYQDQTTHFFPPEGQDVIKRVDGAGVAIKYFSRRAGDKDVSFSYYGDTLDAFTGKAYMNLGTNPPAANVTTYYVNQRHEGDNNHTVSNQNTNTSHIYLSGLRIGMEDTGQGTFRVEVRWDDYEVDQDVRWTGNIVVKEKVILKEKRVIELNQSRTPNQITRDSVSGLFARPTSLKLEEGAEFRLLKRSRLDLSQKSSFVIEDGSLLEIGDGAELRLGQGDTLRIAAGARVHIQGKGRLRVDKGGVVCLEQGAEVVLEKGRRNLKLHRRTVIPQGYANPRKLIPGK